MILLSINYYTTMVCILLLKILIGAVSVFCRFFCIICSHDIVGAIYYLSPCLRILCIIVLFIVDLQFMAIKDFTDRDIKGYNIKGPNFYDNLLQMHA